MINSENIQNNVINTYKNNQQKVNKETKNVNNDIKNTTQKKPNIHQLISQFELQSKNFDTLLGSIFTKQFNKVSLIKNIQDDNLSSFYKTLLVDKKSIERAKVSVSEDGYYGVNKTSSRILNFAKSIAGDNLGKLNDMKKAVDRGFDKVRRMWGDKLPDISQDTYNKVMEGFDELLGSVNKSI